MKTFYSDYADHCMKFYVRYRKPDFHNEIAKNDWMACDTALASFTKDECDLLCNVYWYTDTIADNIYHLSIEYKIPQNTIWKLVNTLRCEIAKERGLYSST